MTPDEVREATELLARLEAIDACLDRGGEGTLTVTLDPSPLVKVQEVTLPMPDWRGRMTRMRHQVCTRLFGLGVNPVPLEPTEAPPRPEPSAPKKADRVRMGDYYPTRLGFLSRKVVGAWWPGGGIVEQSGDPAGVLFREGPWTDVLGAGGSGSLQACRFSEWDEWVDKAQPIPGFGQAPDAAP